MPFVRVAGVAEIPVGRGRLVEHGDAAVAVFNAGDGRFFACDAVCPHGEGPLADGRLEGDRVVCPWHGWDFELTSGRCRVDAALAVRLYGVRVRDGVVEVEVP
jgi:nitrite reductase (NADH) small subunit